MSAVEIRLKTELYSPSALDAAVEVYRDYCDLEVEKADDAYVIRINSAKEASPAEVLDELCNYALGATVEEQPAS